MVLAVLSFTTPEKMVISDFTSATIWLAKMEFKCTTITFTVKHWTVFAPRWLPPPILPSVYLTPQLSHVCYPVFIRRALTPVRRDSGYTMLLIRLLCLLKLFRKAN